MNQGKKTTDLDYAIIILILYLTVLFNIDRIGPAWNHVVICLHPCVVAMSPLIILITIVIPAFRRLTFFPALLIWVGITMTGFFFLQFYPGVDATISSSRLIDLFVLSVSVLIAQWLAKNLILYKHVLENNSSDLKRVRVLEMDYAKPLIADEIIRSRRYQYPVTVLAIRGTKNSARARPFLNFLPGAQKSMPRKDWRRITNILVSQARQSDLVIKDTRAGCFLLICPELSEKDHAETIMKRITSKMDPGLGISLQFGASTFPEDERTIDAVIEQAKLQVLRDFPA